MNAKGLFFLTKRVVQTSLKSPDAGFVRGWQFDLVERLDNNTESRVVVFWRGAEADQTIVALWEKLKAGCAMQLELERLRVVDGVLRGRIVSCALAPDRWPGRTEAASSAIASAMTSAHVRSTQTARP